eukprot:CAMPEP_0202957404 /NCGR_PEP_ID=MMETSP1396-20130829/1802_1 /ASSEMBLY_ACC=CAM_ASM_000872 /TAXON_ID= /ORGANISM="Pseudokeronopsis sp., Strain Brazil" /LENGTH=88 /DNA_ID=CAMNT_0049674857 /DNA_START=457 /DNA_END=720 /DNA_ORIENTATION=-
MEAYISNLVVHLVADPQAQMNEAFRVLKSGSFACLSLGGKVNSLTILKDMMKEFGIYEEGKDHESFANDHMRLKEMMFKAGFGNVKIW